MTAVSVVIMLVCMLLCLRFVAVRSDKVDIGEVPVQKSVLAVE